MLPPSPWLEHTSYLAIDGCGCVMQVMSKFYTKITDAWKEDDTHNYKEKETGGGVDEDEWEE